MRQFRYREYGEANADCTHPWRGVFTGVLISHILGGEIVFTHATVAIRQGSENWPLQI
ncbi:hypothetical protein JOD24_001806 [Kroppenstedtia sanguinis]|uniref:Uncharacterized protein n=1 Tax=Kroppenstedtia sanguinis TaxID=1380684 RepID=A0ABW4C5M1_9BACL